MAARAAYRSGRLMPANLNLTNEQAPPAVTSEACGFVFLTTPRPRRKDAINDFIYEGGSPV